MDIVYCLLCYMWQFTQFQPKMKQNKFILCIKFYFVAIQNYRKNRKYFIFIIIFVTLLHYHCHYVFWLSEEDTFVLICFIFTKLQYLLYLNRKFSIIIRRILYVKQHEPTGLVQNIPNVWDSLSVSFTFYTFINRGCT